MNRMFPLILNSVFFIAGMCALALGAPLPCALCLLAISLLFIWTQNPPQTAATIPITDENADKVKDNDAEDIQQLELSLHVQELTATNQLLRDEIEQLRKEQNTCPHPLYLCPLTSALPINLDNFFTTYIKNRFDSLQNNKIHPKYHCSIPDAEIYLSASALGIICDNVIDNMLKFSSVSEDIHEKLYIRITDMEEDVLIIFKNEGEGISERETAMVFDLNYQGANKKSGTGLGLAQVNALVSDYGGRAWAKSSKNAGFTLYLQLPQKPKSPVHA